MRWRVYTKLVSDSDRVFTRWYWRKETPEGAEESAEGFLTRVQCEADAVKYGCRLEDQAPEERLPISPLLSRAVPGRA